MNTDHPLAAFIRTLSVIELIALINDARRANDHDTLTLGQAELKRRAQEGEKEVVIMPRGGHARCGTVLFTTCMSCGGSAIVHKKHCPSCGVELNWNS